MTAGCPLKVFSVISGLQEHFTKLGELVGIAYSQETDATGPDGVLQGDAGWWSVMAVVALSWMTRIRRACCTETLIRAGIPAWKKVESPMVATMGGLAAEVKGTVKTGGLADPGPHAVHPFPGPEVNPQDIAADVAWKDTIRKGFPYSIKGGPMAATGAQGGAGGVSGRYEGGYRGQVQEGFQYPQDDVRS